MIFINGKQYTIKLFPDGTPNMTDINIQDRKDIRTVVIEWRYENNGEQVILYNLVNFIKDVLCVPVQLILPYVPNARMDRVKNSIQEVHTLKYFCKFINDLDFDRVYVTDVHSPVTMTLLERAIEFDVSSKVINLIDNLNVDYIFFPDKGALERYDYLITRTPFYGVKTRDWTNGKIIGYSVENPYNIPEDAFASKSILIIDDISSYGGTFFHASNALKEKGFGDIYLYVTHCENNILKGDVIKSDNVKHIFTTNSIFTGQHSKITVIE